MNILGIDEKKIKNWDKYELYYKLLKCNICNKISYPPCLCEKCSQCYCQSCLNNQKLECPICKRKLILFPKNLKDIYDDFQIECQKCKNFFKIDNLNEHIKNCGIPVKKKNNKIKISSDDEDDDDKNQNLKESIKTIDNKDKEIYELKLRVSKLEKLCENFKKQIDELKQLKK